MNIFVAEISVGSEYSTGLEISEVPSVLGIWHAFRAARMALKLGEFFIFIARVFCVKE